MGKAARSTGLAASSHVPFNRFPHRRVEPVQFPAPCFLDLDHAPLPVEPESAVAAALGLGSSGSSLATGCPDSASSKCVPRHCQHAESTRSLPLAGWPRWFERRTRPQRCPPSLLPQRSAPNPRQAGGTDAGTGSLLAVVDLITAGSSAAPTTNLVWINAVRLAFLVAVAALVDAAPPRAAADAVLTAAERRQLAVVGVPADETVLAALAATAFAPRAVGGHRATARGDVAAETSGERRQ